MLTLLAGFILAPYVVVAVVAIANIVEGPAFESKSNAFDLQIGNTIYQIKAVDEAYIPVDLAMAHYTATPMELAQIQMDAINQHDTIHPMRF